jgi:hypothetical protein
MPPPSDNCPNPSHRQTQALARRMPRRRCVAADLPGRGTRSILREPRASLESTRGGSGRTLEKDCPRARENRPGIGESRQRQSPQTLDLTNAIQELIIPKSSQPPICLADYSSCPIPAEPTHKRSVRGWSRESNVSTKKTRKHPKRSMSETTHEPSNEDTTPF